MKEPKKLFKSYRVHKNLRPAAEPAAAYEPVQKHKVTPVYRGDLITYVIFKEITFHGFAHSNM